MAERRCTNEFVFIGECCEEEHDLCPMGCGSITEDCFGGPCSACWDLAELRSE